MQIRTTPIAAGIRKRLITFTTVTMMVATTGVLAHASAASAEPSPQPSGIPADSPAKKKSPPTTSSEPVTVMVELAGDPVAVTESVTPMSRDQRRQRKDQLRNEQTPVAQRIRELGGTVVNTYQSAYNGVQVHIPANRADALADIGGVVAVHPMQPMKRRNTAGVPLIGAPAAWSGVAGAAGLRGEGIKVAIIDTGIDYTHADFGGPGTEAAYDEANAADTAPANPAWFGPAAPKVKGGIDLVGDTYNADKTSESYQPNPIRDDNPLDCHGHGTHVAGTTAGFGVTADGRTYTGPYDESTLASQQWKVGPGVAPKADLYAVRVFGCSGSSDVVVAAIEWAVDNDMDVINMSLGDNFGHANDPTSVSANNAARKGIIVVASSGNAGEAPYITGAPATGTDVISVAASDPVSTFPGARLTLSTGATVDAIVANGAPITTPNLPVKVLRAADGTISLGCDRNEYNVPGVAGALVVVQRGVCARVARAVFGQQAGAAAVLMINNAEGLPPYEGPILGNPDPPGEEYRVTIPFLGVSSTDGPALEAADGGTVAIAPGRAPNPGYLAPASFTSGGARSGDSWLKPDATAPGVSIFSAAVGTGNAETAMSGTSMAAPHTAGLAALVRQAHPNWRQSQYWKAAIVNTADPAKVTGYSPRIAGSGLIQAPPAVSTEVVALGDRGTATLNFGFAELRRDFGQKKKVTLRNFGRTAATYNVSIERSDGSPHTANLKTRRVTIPANSTRTVELELRVPAATAGDSSEFNDVAGLVVFTPASAGDNHNVTLRVPYYFVPQAISNVETRIDLGALRRTGTTTATLTNRRAPIAGTADWFAWGLSDSRDRAPYATDLRAAGAQSQEGQVNFAISTYHRWSNAAFHTFTVHVDVNRDGVDDYAVVGRDYGMMIIDDHIGQMAVEVIDLRTQNDPAAAPSIENFADAPHDGTTLVLPVAISQLCAAGSPCLSEANPRFDYRVSSESVDRDGKPIKDTMDGVASFNAFTPSITTGVTTTVAPNATVTQTITINRAEWAQTPSRGLMIVTDDNRSGGDDAQLIRVT